MDEKKQDFFIDCYFRQSWKDDRLVFNNSGVKELPMNWQFLNKIWKPDTFFVNGKKSKMHKITVPNKFLRITPNGQVSYSQRFVVVVFRISIYILTENNQLFVYSFFF